MKTIGLLGGMSWESSADYYRLINQDVSRRLGGLHSAKIAMFSVDFGPIENEMRKENWPAVQDAAIDGARRVEAAGADVLVMTTNTVHKCFDAIQASVSIPMIHIADPTGAAIQAAGLKKIALLGTRFTMEHDFYKARLHQKFGLDVLVPDSEDRLLVNRVVFDELCRGQIRPESKREFVRIIDALVQSGAQGVVLGCTEIPLLVKPDDASVPLFDTTALHAKAAVDWALTE